MFGWVLLLSVIGEELGWCGYALPRILTRTTPLTASLVLGGVWAAWHLPLLLHPAALQNRLPAAWFVLQILGQSVLLTWLYERSRGSVLLPALLHAAANTSVGVLPVLPLDTGGSSRPLWLALVALYLLAAVVVVRTGMHRRPPGQGDLRHVVSGPPADETRLGPAHDPFKTRNTHTIEGRT